MNKLESIAKAEALLSQIENNGLEVDLIVLPEMALIGYMF